MEKQQDLRETLHEVVERTRLKALNAMTGILATSRLNQHVYSSAHWQTQQLQLRIHALTLEHAARTLMSLSADLAVNSALFDVDARREKFKEEEARARGFVDKVQNMYLGNAPSGGPLPQETVVRGLSDALLNYSTKGLASNRREQISQELMEALDPKKAFPSDLLTSVYQPPPSSWQDGLSWLNSNEIAAETREENPTSVDTMHSRLMLHP